MKVMQPNEQYAPDYLDQIAVGPQKRGPSNMMFFGLIIGGILLAVMVLVLAMASGGGSQKDFDRLMLRLQNTQTITEEAQDKLSNSQLRSSNAQLTTLLIQAQRDITQIQTPSYVDDKELPEDLASSENTTDLNAKLEDAQLNGVYDRTYAREMSYLLQSTAILMSSVHEASNNTQLRETLDTRHADLTAIEEQFTAYYDSTETSIFD